MQKAQMKGKTKPNLKKKKKTNKKNPSKTYQYKGNHYHP